MSTPAEGIVFTVAADGETPLEAVRKADRLARNTLADWPTDWPIEFTAAAIEHVYHPAERWTATLHARAVDDTPPVTSRQHTERS